MKLTDNNSKRETIALVRSPASKSRPPDLLRLERAESARILFGLQSLTVGIAREDAPPETETASLVLTQRLRTVKLDRIGQVSEVKTQGIETSRPAWKWKCQCQRTRMGGATGPGDLRLIG